MAPGDERRLVDILTDSEAGLVPARLRQFLFQGRAPSAHDQTWGFFSHGYSAAFEELAEQALRSWGRRDYLCAPVFFLCRHSLELALKSTIAEYGEAAGDIPRLEGHSLLGLWRQLQDVIQRVGFSTDDDWTRYCEKLIQHLHSFDPDGERFRYPQSKSGDTFPYTRVELEGLVKAHWSISLYCGAAMSMLHESMP